jgi:dTDP-4-dehydrorhamnose reductase
MKVLVIGAAGQLGQGMVERFAGEHDVTAASRREVDVTDHRALRAFVLDRRPEAVINCAAFTDVDGSNDQQELALDINGFAVRTLARATTELDAVLVHFSTDFVFPGTTATPYTEEDAPEPQSVYAQSKLFGEWVAADNPKHYVLRVESLFGGPRARSSVDRIVAAVGAGQPAPVFVDRIVSPSFVDDVTDASAHLLRSGAPFGVYHCVNTGAATWLEVGQEIARLLQQPETTLKPISVDDVTLKASRPRYAALNNAKLARAGYTMPTWQDALRRYLSRRQGS